MNDLFKNEAPRHMALLRDKAQQGDMIEVIKEAHGLAGTARKIEAVGLYELCMSIERFAKDGNKASLMESLFHLEAAYNDALHQANKTTIDRRLEGVEASIVKFEASLKQEMNEMKLALRDHIKKQDEILHSIRDNTDEVKRFTESVGREFTSMVQAILGKKQVPLEIFQRIMTIFSLIAMALATIIIFLITGKHLGWIPPIP